MAWEIYRLTSPSGGTYIGLTNQGCRLRWPQHVSAAKHGHTLHLPLGRAIQQHGPKSFVLDVMDILPTRELAAASEIALIAELNPRYNASPGGECASESAMLGAAKWRAANPEACWKQAYRASRMALRAAGVSERRDPRFSKWGGRLWIKSEKVSLARSNTKKSLRVAEHWATQDQSVRCANIAKAQKVRHAAMTPEERAERTAKARAAIVHSDAVKDARREGIKRFWAEMKADPAKYAELKARKSASAKAARSRPTT